MNPDQDAWTNLGQNALREFLEYYPRKSTWPQHIPIYDLPPLEKDRESEQAGCLTSLYS